MNQSTKIIIAVIIAAIIVGGGFYLWQLYNTNQQEISNTDKNEISCAGFAGTQCPNGYYCTDIPPNILDASGVCKKIDLDKLSSCLQNRDVTIVCSTKFDCKKQRELLGDLFQFFKVKYDDDYTDCEKYGNLCESEYNDTEMIGWIIPKEEPYPMREANKYPNPTFRGARTMEQVIGLTGCEKEVL
ncbi:MAG: hypothetical protein ACD_12C00336G0003 [uncultured bacterium]|nr:MAG: hypothetical protein ACD_12C00336G0003 [uncultured bacterium]